MERGCKGPETRLGNSAPQKGAETGCRTRRLSSPLNPGVTAPAQGHRLSLGLSRSKRAPGSKLRMGRGNCAPPAAAASPEVPTPRSPAYLGRQPRWWRWSSRNPSHHPQGSRALDLRSQWRRPRQRRRAGPGTALAPPRAGTPTDPPVTAATAAPTNAQPPARSWAGHWWRFRGGGSLK